jgi:hypothetical protein
VAREPSDLTAEQASEQRVESIRTLALKLAELTILNTPGMRARCRTVATEIIRLLDDEDAGRRSLPTSDFEEHHAAVQRLAEALRACREAGEQAQLTRLYTKSERLERQSKNKQSR